MRKIILKIIVWKLKIISKLFLARYKPKIVAVTGSVGKSSTKEAIYTVLRAKFNCRRSLGSYNNELGVPLTIMGEESPGSNIFRWILITFRSLLKLIYQKNYPEILVLEMGVDKPGDLKYLLSFVSPEIAVITSIAPTHLEALKSEAEIYREKSRLAFALKKSGTAVLNFDDRRLRKLGLNLKRKVQFFGLDSQANMSASAINQRPLGMIFNIDYAGSTVPARVSSIGRGQIYAALAACSVAVILGMDLVSASLELKKIKALKGRLKILGGKRGTTVVDDSYNSSPAAASASLSAAYHYKKNNGCRRLVAILGDMLELGAISRRAHLNLGREAAEVCDLVIGVGNEAKNIHQAAEEKLKDNALWFSNSSIAAKKIINIVKPGDLILIKGSQGARMEKVSAVLLKNKSDIKHLPRMSGYWEDK